MVNPIMIFFAEPNVADLTWSSNAESMYDWINRSTKPLAIEMRRFLNEHISMIPEEYQKTFIDGLISRWNETILELLIARIMQEVGGDIEIEKTTAIGKRPDLWVSFDDGQIIIEATAPKSNSDVAKMESEKETLLKIIENYAPTGWSVDVSILPVIGHNDSKQEFKRAIQKILKIEPPSSIHDEPMRIIHELSIGTIELVLYPATTEAQGLGFTPFTTFIDDSLRVIRKAIINKIRRKQLHGVNNPALIALSLNSVSRNFEEFDRVLFGESVDSFDSKINHIEKRFQPNGIFLKNRGKKTPTIAGLLAFRNVSTMIIEGPVLYKHPRFTGDFPSAFKLFEQRWYDSAANEIKVIPGQLGEIINRLNLVKLNE